MRKSHVFILALGAVLVGGLVFVTARHMIRMDPAKARRVNAPLPVAIAAVRQVTLDDVVGGSGTLEQSATVTLVAPLSAKVVAVPVGLGETVKKGALLVAWDDRRIAAAIEANRELVSAALQRIRSQERQLERYKELRDGKLAAELEVDRSESALAEAREDMATAKLALAQAEIDFESTRLMSPIDGIVLRKPVNVGELTSANPRQEVMELGVLDPVHMVAQVGDESIEAVRLGQTAEIGFDAYPGTAFTGELVRLDPNIDPIKRTFAAHIRIPNPQLSLRPGLSGFARIRRPGKLALAVPSVAVMNPAGAQAVVFVVDDADRAHLRSVRTGLVSGTLTEILDGLREGERVVTAGQIHLRDDDLVRPSDTARARE